MTSPDGRPREILLVTGSRGEWGYIRPILRLIDADDRLSYRLAVTNMHLLPEFGASHVEIARDGFEIHDELYMALDGSTDVSMTKSLGIFLLSIADALHRSRPDIVLLAGDRGEQMMAALAGAHMNIPVAHIQAGEVSGNVDGQTRHAIARYAHLHFAANEDAAQRLLRSGEEEFRVHRVGAPQLDELIHAERASAEEIARRFHVDPSRPLVLLVQHPVTEQVRLAGQQMALTLTALKRLGVQVVLVYPNNDAGSVELRATIEEHRGPWLHVERNLSRRDYAGLLQEADAMVGNSSSGLLEAPSFRLPAVNIGRRQEGRMRGDNVIDVDHDTDEITAAVKKALDSEFRDRLSGENPYGDGRASERIVRVLAETPIDEALLYKRLTF